ncbi:hypothetical protein IPZ68_05370 [Streptomyces arenae]|nr:hypothetical protein [Streptomyces arenae]
MPASSAVSLSGPDDRTAQWVRSDRDRLIHPHLPSTRTDRTVMVEGRGCYVRDSASRRHLDAAAVLGMMQVGHGRSEMAAAAQMGTLECFHLWESMSRDKAIELAVRLTDLAPDGPHTRIRTPLTIVRRAPRAGRQRAAHSPTSSRTAHARRGCMAPGRRRVRGRQWPDTAALDNRFRPSSANVVVRRLSGRPSPHADPAVTPLPDPFAPKVSMQPAASPQA